MLCALFKTSILELDFDTKDVLKLFHCFSEMKKKYDRSKYLVTDNKNINFENDLNELQNIVEKIIKESFSKKNIFLEKRDFDFIQNCFSLLRIFISNNDNHFFEEESEIANKKRFLEDIILYLIDFFHQKLKIDFQYEIMKNGCRDFVDDFFTKNFVLDDVSPNFQTIIIEFIIGVFKKLKKDIKTELNATSFKRMKLSNKIHILMEEINFFDAINYTAKILNRNKYSFFMQVVLNGMDLLKIKSFEESLSELRYLSGGLKYKCIEHFMIEHNQS
jgi:hypothetical protein